MATRFNPAVFCNGHSANCYSIATHFYLYPDTQIYISVLKDELVVKVDLRERFTSGAHTWFLSNGLQLNPQKSEVIQFAVGRRGECVLYTLKFIEVRA